MEKFGFRVIRVRSKILEAGAFAAALANTGGVDGHLMQIDEKVNVWPFPIPNDKMCR